FRARDNIAVLGDTRISSHRGHERWDHSPDITRRILPYWAMGKTELFFGITSHYPALPRRLIASMLSFTPQTSRRATSDDEKTIGSKIVFRPASRVVCCRAA